MILALFVVAVVVVVVALNIDAATGRINDEIGRRE